MAIIVIEHEMLETTARLGNMLRACGHHVRMVRIHKGDKLPADLNDVDGMIVMGGTMDVDQQDKYPFLCREIELITESYSRGIAVVGICLGAQLIAMALGGEVEPMARPEIGWFELTLSYAGMVDPIFKGLPKTSMQIHTHGYKIIQLPEDCHHLASSSMCRNQAFRVGTRIYGFQYHFEWLNMDISQIVQFMSPWISLHGYDSEQILSKVDSYYEIYQSQGEKLSGNITDLLFPIDRRYKKIGGEVENYHNW